jgi:hypothetical protein
MGLQLTKDFFFDNNLASSGHISGDLRSFVFFQSNQNIYNAVRPKIQLSR